ncbi:hypothetical protein C8R43DRAFT_1193911 [Mycena crocata]|nr:hypothetical protein C8R43DRAFT_1193911 [Mycena crocata]
MLDASCAFACRWYRGYLSSSPSTLAPLDTPSPPTLSSTPTLPQHLRYRTHIQPGPRHRRSFAAAADNDLDLAAAFQYLRNVSLKSIPLSSNFPRCQYRQCYFNIAGMGTNALQALSLIPWFQNHLLQFQHWASNFDVVLQFDRKLPQIRHWASVSKLCFSYDHVHRKVLTTALKPYTRNSIMANSDHFVFLRVSFNLGTSILQTALQNCWNFIDFIDLVIQVGGWDYSCMDPTSKANLTTAPLLTYNTETVVLDVEAIYLLASQFLTLNNETIVFDLRIQVACKNYGCIYNQIEAILNVSRIVDTLELRFNNGLISCCDRTRNVVWLTSDRGNYGFRAGSAGTMEVESECRIYGPWLQAVGIGIGISLVAIQPRFKTHIHLNPSQGRLSFKLSVRGSSMPKVFPSCWDCDPEAVQHGLAHESCRSRNPPELDSLQTIQLVHFNSDIISTPVGFYFIQDAARLLNLTSTTRGTQLNILTINYEYMQTRTTPGHRRCTRACMEAAHKVSLDHSSRSSSHIRSAAIILASPPERASPRRLSTAQEPGPFASAASASGVGSDLNLRRRRQRAQGLPNASDTWVDARGLASSRVAGGHK